MTNELYVGRSVNGELMADRYANFSFTGEEPSVNAKWVGAFAALVSGAMVMTERGASIGGVAGTAIAAAVTAIALEKSANWSDALQLGGVLGGMGSVAGGALQERLLVPDSKTNFGLSSVHSSSDPLWKIEGWV